MNKFDIKVLLEETKKQTARDIIRMLNENLAKCFKQKETLIDEIGTNQMAYLENETELKFLRGYERGLTDIIDRIEDTYKVGARKILEAANSKPE